MASSNKTNSKEAKAVAKAARRKASKERRQQLWQAFNVQRKEDKLLLPLMAAALVIPIVVAVILGLVTGWIWFLTPIGILLGILLAFILFGRRVQSTVYRKAEGQSGAAAWALENMRGTWRVTNGVAQNTSFDAVHRVIGKPGVVLVGEGAAHRVKPLIAQEKKRVARLVGDTPIYDVVVGNEDGQVPLKSLERHLSKLPNNINAKRVDALDARLAAIGARMGAQIPKGPMPQGAKMRSMQRTMRRH